MNQQHCDLRRLDMTNGTHKKANSGLRNGGKSFQFNLMLPLRFVYKFKFKHIYCCRHSIHVFEIKTINKMLLNISIHTQIALTQFQSREAAKLFWLFLISISASVSNGKGSMKGKKTKKETMGRRRSNRQDKNSGPLLICRLLWPLLKSEKLKRTRRESEDSRRIFTSVLCESTSLLFTSIQFRKLMLYFLHFPLFRLYRITCIRFYLGPRKYSMEKRASEMWWDSLLIFKVSNSLQDSIKSFGNFQIFSGLSTVDSSFILLCGIVWRLQRETFLCCVKTIFSSMNFWY